MSEQDPDIILQSHLANLNDDSYSKWNRAYEALEPVKPEEMKKIIDYLEPRGIQIPLKTTTLGRIRGYFFGSQPVDIYDVSVYQERPFQRVLQVWREYEERKLAVRRQFDARQEEIKQRQLDARSKGGKSKKRVKRVKSRRIKSYKSRRS
jgi:hypothetical protein